MILLILDITGDLGQRLAQHALARNIRVRGLARNPTKLSADISNHLESFVQSETYGDIAALNKAMSGVDAAICAHSSDPVLYPDGNLAALRAAERAEVRIFVASSFTNDWTNIQLRDYPIYDPIMLFADQAKLTSSVKPIFIINGAFVEWMFRPAPDGTLQKTYYEDADELKYPWSTMDDAAAYTIEILMHNSAVQNGEGGIFRIRSGEHTLREQAEVFEAVTGKRMKLINGGSLENAAKALEAAQRDSFHLFWGYLEEASAVVAAKGLWQYKKPVLDLEHFRKPTTLEEYLKTFYRK